ncbi:TetR/AcrR family transcriptional regulator [Aneurinibacillus aneurinilyticus]|jgi:AcrR family transcriptional regulator|uniref:Transcriptional regulator, TetR family n=1 Tax=Aneurinibacillus aneurinilyticus ATCC 12856 TaxID=649747 RepID=U1WMX9_ANEAE|nr:TetR/AcrR family transcriptional regulator [Aneurinibacillus aneurinilyticus]ERI09949.1 transcriptional regulator, TetR family [Aneurinibacillus aneurinilyticus ATCC 12856]MCI1692606.1 TetR/AcrR family transcriptional regulator [Aneurinibacillus aneurinilyticus]MED0670172.1 TetR/AcrR family transcriptional regulator [Aneurinibacillus aneurinilyticus]MED0705134.1 TetR/AcrR family transcriptional regulator [Aneurinibacillus aneurinilyticus]MED0725630.1 TetR/AcrR family transcriptional regulat
MEKKYSPRVKRTREKILHSAVEIFSQKGFQASTIREIARLAGVNDLTVYRHFESKEKLFTEMFQRHALLSEISEYIVQGITDDFEHDLRAIVRAFISAFRKELPLIKLLLNEAEKMEECRRYVDTFTKNVIHKLAEFFDYYKTMRQIRQDVNSHAVAAGLYSILFARIYALILHGEENSQMSSMSENELVDGWVDLFVAGTIIPEYSYAK